MPDQSASRIPVSSQAGPHPVLVKKVQRHLDRPWRAPVAEHNRAAFERADRWRQASGVERSLILDSGCGTGLSSVQLAQSRPHALVIGLDQSPVRLSRARNRFALPVNLLLLRAECADFWRLARARGWCVDQHYLLYPNPWPKPAHLQRRWHGHPVFPELLALGGVLEVRSNWRLYLEEMALALTIAGREPVGPGPCPSGTLETDFGIKYRRSGQALFGLHCDLDTAVSRTGRSR